MDQPEKSLEEDDPNKSESMTKPKTSFFYDSERSVDSESPNEEDRNFIKDSSTSSEEDCFEDTSHKTTLPKNKKRRYLRWDFLHRISFFENQKFISIPQLSDSSEDPEKTQKRLRLQPCAHFVKVKRRHDLLSRNKKRPKRKCLTFISSSDSE